MTDDPGSWRLKAFTEGREDTEERIANRQATAALRTVIERSAGMTSSSGPSIERSTIGSASSGSR